MFVTALPTIAQMVGTNRILRGVAITHPTGDPTLAADDERDLRERIVEPRARDARHRGRARPRSGSSAMTPDRRAAVVSASFVLEHVPDLVRYGSKPSREPAKLDRLTEALRHLRRRGRVPAQPGLPRATCLPRICGIDPATGGGTRWRAPRRDGTIGDLMDQRSFYDAARRGRRLRAVRLGAEPGPASSRCTEGDTVVGAFAAITRRMSRSRRTCCSRTSRSRRAACTRCATCWPAAASTPHRSRTRSAAARRRWAIATSGAAATSRRRSPRQCGLASASAIDVKSFCAAPVHALVSRPP